MKVALLSSFNADLVPGYLAPLLQERHLDAAFYISGFDQYRQEILDPASNFYASKPDVVLLLLDSQDIFADLIQNPLDYVPERRHARVQSELRNMQHAIEFIHRRLPGVVLFLNTLAAPPTTSLGLLEYNSPYSVRGAVAQYNAGLVELARQATRTYIVDCEALAAEMGWEAWTDERMWLLGRMRLSRSALEAVAGRYRSAIWAACGTPKKVLALDADNTLWGGVVGTDGVEGIQVGYEGLGLAYREFQAEILNLYKRGVLLVLVSKNNPDDIYEVLDTHAAMLLRREHFSALCVNWQDKVANLRQAAAQLNLGLESFVFVDDSSFECAWIQDQLPEVQVLHLPPDPADFVHALRRLDTFTTLALTEEDLARGKLYREEQQRKECQQSAGSLEEFYRSLEMHVQIRHMSGATLKRAAQLTQKTNQFNLTTRRYTEADLSRIAGLPQSQVFTLSLSDRFGDNGLVGVAILICEGENSRIDTLLLSCRVMGRTVETAFLAFLADWARANGSHALVGEFQPTRKNMPVRDLYEHHGFEPLDAAGTWWRYDLQNGRFCAPDYMKLDLPKEMNNAQPTAR